MSSKASQGSVGRITQWSYSRWNDWDQCPAKAKYKHVLKIKEAQGPAAARGDDVGKRAEAWLAGKEKKMPVELAGLSTESKALRTLKPAVQLQWALTTDWEPTGWFEPNTWVRIKTDIVAEVKKPKLIEIVDGKTGKVNEKHNLQLSLYAIGGFAHFALYEQVRVRLFYFDQNIVLPEGGKLYHRDELGDLQEAWLERVTPMLKDKKFEPKTGNHCRWCSYARSKNGPCEYG